MSSSSLFSHFLGSCKVSRYLILTFWMPLGPLIFSERSKLETNNVQCTPSITSLWKCFWWHLFFTFHIYIFDAFWPNFVAVSFQLLKLWPFFWRAVLTRWRFYGQHTVQVTNTWNSCKMLTTQDLYLSFIRILAYTRKWIFYNF